MQLVDVGQFEDSFVIHFGVVGRRINAYTLATTLVGMSDAARAANAIINPGFDIEVVVEAFSTGSFKATISTLYRGAGNLFSRDSLKAIVLSVIANIIYQHTFAPDPHTVVNVGTTEVVIEQGDTRVVVPRVVHDATQHVSESPQFRKGLGEAFRAIAEDPDVRTIGFSPHPDAPAPPVEIPSERLATVSGPLDEPDVEARELIETADLEILRAILEKSRRRWEFAWRGVKIAAPILDDTFYVDFCAHRVTIAPGDILKVRLRIRQRRAPGVGIFINESYEVVEVIEHVSRPTQERISF